jgi:hypothetical protein
LVPEPVLSEKSPYGVVPFESLNASPLSSMIVCEKSALPLASWFPAAVASIRSTVASVDMVFSSADLTGYAPEQLHHYRPKSGVFADSDVDSEHTLPAKVRHVVKLLAGVRNGDKWQPVVIACEEEPIAKIFRPLDILQSGHERFDLGLSHRLRDRNTQRDRSVTNSMFRVAGVSTMPVWSRNI